MGDRAPDATVIDTVVDTDESSDFISSAYQPEVTLGPGAI